MERTKTDKTNKRLLITIPEDLHERLRRQAKKERRSMSNYICYLLDKNLDE